MANSMGTLDWSLVVGILLLLIFLVVWFFKRISKPADSKHEGTVWFVPVIAIVGAAIFLPIPIWVIGAFAILAVAVYLFGTYNLERKAKRGTKGEKKTMEEETPEMAEMLRKLERRLMKLEAEKGVDEEQKEELIAEIELLRHNLATTAASKKLSKVILSMEGEEVRTEQIAEQIEQQIKSIDEELGKMTNFAALDQAGKAHVSELLSTNIELQNKLISAKEEKASAVDTQAELIEEVTGVIEEATSGGKAVADAVFIELQDIGPAELKMIKKAIAEVKGNDLSPEAEKALEDQRRKLYDIHNTLDKLLNRKILAIQNIRKATREVDAIGENIEKMGEKSHDASTKYKDFINQAKEQQDALAKEVEALIAKKAGPAQLAKSSIKRIALMYNSLIRAVKMLKIFEQYLANITENTTFIAKKMDFANRSMYYAAQFNSQLVEMHKSFGDLINRVKSNAGEGEVAEMGGDFFSTVIKITKYEKRVARQEYKLNKEVIGKLAETKDAVTKSIAGLNDEFNDLVGLRNLIIESLKKLALRVVQQQAKINKEFEAQASELEGKINTAEVSAKKMYKVAKAARKV